MNKAELKALIKEAISDVESEKRNRNLNEAVNNDLAYLEERLVQEGLWDTIKQKASGAVSAVKGAVSNVGDKAKEVMVQPILNMLMDKVAKSDPKGFAALKQATDKGQKIGDILQRPEIKQKQAELQKEFQKVNESECDESVMEEYMNEVLDEARKLSNNPRNIARRKLYAKKKAALQKAMKKGKLVVKDKKTGKKRKATKIDYEAAMRKLMRSENPPKAEEPNKPEDKKGQSEIPVVKDPETGKILQPGDHGYTANLARMTGQNVSRNLNRPPVEEPEKQSGGVKGFFAKVWKWIKDHPKISIGIALAVVATILIVLNKQHEGDALMKKAMDKASTNTSAASGASNSAKERAMNSAAESFGVGKDSVQQIKHGMFTVKDEDGKLHLFTQSGDEIDDPMMKQQAAPEIFGGNKTVATGVHKDNTGNPFGDDVSSAKKDGSYLQDLTYDDMKKMGQKVPDKVWADQYDAKDPRTWKVKPAINSTQGYIAAQHQNDLMYQQMQGRNADGDQVPQDQIPSQVRQVVSRAVNKQGDEPDPYINVRRSDSTDAQGNRIADFTGTAKTGAQLQPGDPGYNAPINATKRGIASQMDKDHEEIAAANQRRSDMNREINQALEDLQAGRGDPDAFEKVKKKYGF